MRLPAAARIAGLSFQKTLTCAFLAALSTASWAADLAAARTLFSSGKYEEALKESADLSDDEQRVEDWPVLRIQTLQSLGRYSEARQTLDAALQRLPNAVRLRVLGYETMRLNGDLEAAKKILDEVAQLASWREWGYPQPADRVALGRAALLAGADPKRVLEKFLDPVRKAKPDFIDVYLASGELALAKSDYALAAKTFGEAAKKAPDDPEVNFGLARAFVMSDGEAMRDALKKTLDANPNHVGAHLRLAEYHIDGEHLDLATEAIQAALKVNPNLPRAHALRAVVAELQNDQAGYREARAAALKLWTTNPEVDHLIGRKLSEKYRFAEGAEHQRAALAFEPDYLPAKGQLAQDLLRLGNTEEGWELAEQIAQADPYDVLAFNMLQLRDSIAHFRSLETEHFIVRMDPKEADIYGDEVLKLLEGAYQRLCGKYGLQPKQKTIVEIFPDQKDFAIRTFGLPGGAGYLGVCFGRVITANSPASRPGSPANWQSVLWHEFAHVVTLQLTKNRMPRWLSEGISVYEERQAKGNWGEQMKPRYRAMILGEDLTPVSQLSAAFLRPKTPIHLAFAYYQSSLAVEYLLERFGLDTMKKLFAEMATGTTLNDALAKYAAPLEQIDREFMERAKQLALGTAPKLNWDKPKAQDVASEGAYNQWLADHPDNYTALLESARKLVEAKKWQEAKAPLQHLIELYPNQHNADSAYYMLSKVHRELGETEEELALLKRVADLSADATEAYGRLIEIGTERGDWPLVLDSAARFEAVNPLSPIPHRAAAQAHEAQKATEPAIKDYQTLLALQPTDSSEVHFHLASLLHQSGNPEAKRHVLLALEDAPRYREALKLLVEINRAAAPR